MQCSVVVTYANDAPYVGRLLDDLEQQTLRQIEVIAVDNGSSDGSAALVAARCGADHRFRNLVHQGGAIGGARNLGTAAANGAYVLLAEGNDMLPRDALKRLVNTAVRNESDVAVCAFDYVNDERSHYHNGFHTSVAGLSDRDGPLPIVGRALVSDLLATPCNKLFRRAFLETHGIRYETEGFYEEHAFWCDVADAGPRVGYTREALYHVRDEPAARRLWNGAGHAFDAVKALRSLARRLDRAEDQPLLAKLCVRLAWERLTFSLRMPAVRIAFVDACLKVVDGLDPALLRRERDEYIPEAFVSEMLDGAEAFASAA